jgi:hypothetical protein
MPGVDGQIEPVGGADFLNDINENFEELAPTKYVRRYFVDNINGSASNDGLSWASAFAEVSQAVTAWEAYRITLPNIYGKAAIYVRGTGTKYAALTALPNYCDIIGVGATPNGNGTGIAIIGADGADGIAGTARGLGLFNLQIQSGGAFWCCDFVQLLRSRIEGCCFQANTHAADGGIRFTGASGGVIIKDCMWGGSGLVHPVVGIQISGANFDNSKVEGNIIIGTTAGVLVDAGVANADLTVFKNNHIGDGGRGCVTAIDDNATAGMIMYDTNVVMGTNKICCVNNGAARVHGNLTANGFCAVTAS